MTPLEVRAATFGRTLWGYRRAAVDGLLERAVMEANQSPKALISGTRLESEWRGYSRFEVREFLGELTEDGIEHRSVSAMESWIALARAILIRSALVVGVGSAFGALINPAVTATLLVVGVLTIQPRYGRRRYRHFVRLVKHQPSARIRYYVGGIAGSWIYVGAIAVIGGLSGRRPGSIGLTSHAIDSYEATQASSAMISAFVAITISTVVIWVAGPKLVARAQRMILPVAQLLPRSPVERLVFAGVATTAGICEEILYRGFGVAYLRWIDPDMSQAAIVAITAAAFGLAHLYQGPRNVILTGLVGAILASLTLATGTLLPAIVIHVLIDLRIVFLPAKIRPSEETRQPKAVLAQERSTRYLPAK